MSFRGIDVSHWQGQIDWQEVKDFGIDFAIIKAGGSDAGFYKDSTFERNYAEAKAAGLHIGAYYFVGSKCISYADGVADAKRFIQMLSGKQFEYPVYIDLETTSITDKAGATQACIGFCQTMEEAGYYAGIYASDIAGFKDRLEIAQLTHIDKWVARYGSKPAYVTEYGVWQYSDRGAIGGISGNVDLDEAYKNYPELIKKAGLNGFEASIEVPDTDYAKLADKLERIKAIINES